MTKRWAVLSAAAVISIAAFVPVRSQPSRADAEQVARLNNLGVAQIEQFHFADAAATFRRAIDRDRTFAAARINLAVALLYEPDLPAARRAAEEAAAVAADALQPPYLLALIARAENRPADAERYLTEVHARDSEDLGASYLLAQVHLQQQRFADAIRLLETAASAEPYNASVAYSLGQALMRAGRQEDGARWLDRFAALRGSPYATTFGQGYLEQGRYAEAVETTGTEPAFVDEARPDVTFAAVEIEHSGTAAEGSSAFGAALRPGAVGPPALLAARASLTIADFDRDGDPDVAARTAGRVKLFRNDGGTLRDATETSGLPPAPALAVVAGDYDNDGLADLAITTPAGGISLFRNAGGLRFVDVSGTAGLPASGTPALTVAFVDVDHDGDLDLFTAGIADPGRTVDEGRPVPFPAGFAPGHQVLLRNNGNGRFSDVTERLRLDGAGHALAIVPTDFDNRRDIDLLLADAAGPPRLFRNLRDEGFADVGPAVGLSAVGPVRCAAAGDVNKDGFTDFFFGTPAAAGRIALSNGRSAFSLVAMPAASSEATAALFVDYDMDGLLDLLLATPGGLRLLRGLGERWQDLSGAAYHAPAADADFSRAALGAADFDLDGDPDVVSATPTSLTLWRNDGGNRHHSLAVRLTGRVTNRLGVGTKIDMRAGSLKTKIETSAASPAAGPADVLFGLGSRSSADTLRVLWVSGILQAESAPAGGGTRQVIDVQELDRKLSSCPFLYTWNGDRFEFVTDFLGGGETGAWLAPGVRSVPDPEEYVRIAPEQLRSRDGRLEIRVTNELEEVLFLDHASLLAVPHPVGVEVYPDEGLSEPPKPHRLIAVADVRPVPLAFDQEGRDVTDRVAATDRRFVDDLPVLPIRGYAAAHALVLDLTALPPDHTVLLLTGWTDYAFSSDNVAASQAGFTQVPPSLEVLGGDGTWSEAIRDIGFPVGRPQTIAVDLAGLVRGASRKVRIATTMRVYWDRVAVGRRVPSSTIVPARVPLLSANLRWRGYSAESTPDGREPFGYDYARISSTSSWKYFTGRYTREGDVAPLLAAADDRLVISRPGDEVALTFDARQLPALPAGWTRTYLLHADGFSKEMDINSVSPHTVGPLPFHGMPGYPYAPEDVPARVRQALDESEQLATRAIRREVASPLPPR